MKEKSPLVKTPTSRKRRTASVAATAGPIPAFGLTPTQEGMLFHSVLAPHSGVNIQQVIGHFHHALDVDVFRQAWELIVSREPALRVRFRFQGPVESRQEILPEVKLPFEVRDWRALEDAQKTKQWSEWLREDRLNGFPLDQAPLLRVTVFRWAEKENRMVWTFHHALLDGHCFAPILREVFASYESLLQGEKLPEGEAKPFQHYVQWLKQQEHSGREQFWRSYLEGFSTPTPLALSSAMAARKSEEARLGELSRSLDSTHTGKLQNLARRHGLSVNTFLQGAWTLLLAAYAGAEDVVYGLTRDCRRGAPAEFAETLGLFINTVPMRVKVDPQAALINWLQDLRRQQRAADPYRTTPLTEIQRWSEIPAGAPLFESLLVLDRATLHSTLQKLGGEWKKREWRVIDQTNYPLALLTFAQDELVLKLEFDPRRIDAEAARRWMDQLVSLLEAMAQHPESQLRELSMLTAAEKRQLVVDWNQTRLEFPRDKCVPELILAECQRHPQRTAVVFRSDTLAYGELKRRAGQFAEQLRREGVGPDVLVGVCVERSLEMIPAMLGVWIAGGAYVPLDPNYPAERLAGIIADSHMPVLLTQRSLHARLPKHGAKEIFVEDRSTWDNIAAEPPSGCRAEHLAYVIYTSGSTGKPKGVMITHRNVGNFFAGMDQILGKDEPGVWLAVTSISFDISVLELWWTLARGFKVVLEGEEEKLETAPALRTTPAAAPMDFSLFYFSGDEGQNPGNRYRLLLEGAKFADRAGFAAVWTPERHFHAFGGLYPNPAVTSAALAAITQRVAIRAGSVVLPLHHAVRVAEEWSVVDNLSRGRAGIAFASGWHSSDFILAPENYADRRTIMRRQIETFRRLWRGETVRFPGGDGKEVEVRILPRPYRAELPIWITASSSRETYELAGELGANLLTNLLGQTVEELAQKIEIYRKAWRAAGHGPGEGCVTLMLHTFVGTDAGLVRETVRGPFKEYLRTSVDLIKTASNAWSFAAFQTPGKNGKTGSAGDFSALAPTDMEAMLEFAFERYFATSGLFGTPEYCGEMVRRLQEAGANEIACLIDFGIDEDKVLAGLEGLRSLREQCHTSSSKGTERHGILEQMRRHRVTHFQCTPSLARMLLAQPGAPEALASVREFLVGGEALPAALASELTRVLHGNLRNMYGPTETTVWSTSYLVPRDAEEVLIGRPLANTQIYLLDAQNRLMPVGVPGEICIGGEGVARGYWQRADLTAEKFIAPPFEGAEGQKIYRTGDLGRYRKDGEIEYLGRIDHQVKLRGHRIELGEIEAALLADPLVKEAVVAAMGEGRGEPRLVAYVIPRQEKASQTQAGVPDGMAQGVAQWRMIWDETYAQAGQGGQADFDLSGWTSSYTGKAIPAEEMREWVDLTVERIRALRPRRVLEIGCGTGLLLQRLAPECESYCGVDISARALTYLRQQLAGRDLPQVTLRQGAADSTDAWDMEVVDTIILNSVAQYFPDLDYFMRVLERAAEALCDGGKIFIGDVRSLPLLQVFHGSLELSHCQPAISRDTFLERVRNRVAREEELVAHPELFRAMAMRLPRIKGCTVELKHGRAHNEVTRFRYDVVLSTSDSGPRVEPEIVDWTDRRLTAPAVGDWLRARRPEAVVIRRVPNARLRAESELLHWLANPGGPETVQEFRDWWATVRHETVEPEEIAEAGISAGYAVSLRPSLEVPEAFDAVFWINPKASVEWPAAGDTPAAKTFDNYVNQPALARREGKLAGELRRRLRQTLPEIMVPSAVVVLDALPLTPNGKVDRKRLPSPERQDAEVGATYTAPAGPVEEALFIIWRDLLGLEKISATDSFFRIGGHSLLATQLVSRLRELFKVEIPLRHLFEAPTIRDLARRMVAEEPRPGAIQTAAEIINRLDRMTVEEVERERGRLATP